MGWKQRSYSLKLLPIIINKANKHNKMKKCKFLPKYVLQLIDIGQFPESLKSPFKL